MLENLSVEYKDGYAVPNSAQYIEPDMAVMYLKNDVFPSFMYEVYDKTTSYRDAVLHQLAQSYPAEQHGVLTLFAKCFNTNTDEETHKLTALAEYAVPLAISVGETDLAIKFLSRVNPTRTSSWVRSSAEAIKARMGSEMYKTMLLGSTVDGMTNWKARKTYYGYPAD
jgi:hypothetical protein